jgi:hypothetical protein
MQQGMGEVIEGVPATVAPVTFASGAVVVVSPRIDVLTLAPRTLKGTIFPPECMDVGLALFEAEELANI